MKDIQQIKQSRFLKKSDLVRALTLTINDVREENVALRGEPEELRHVLHFEEIDKSLNLKWTNARTIGEIVGSRDMDEWSGHRIVVFHDPDVLYEGRAVGGVRVKAVTK